MPNPQPPLSVKQAHLESGISKRTIQYHLTIGTLPGHKLPGQTSAWIINRDDWETWLAQRQNQAIA